MTDAMSTELLDKLEALSTHGWLSYDEKKTVMAALAELTRAPPPDRSAPRSVNPPDGWVMVPVEPTLEWAHRVATIRQGESDVPRCEAPSDYAVGLASDWIKRVLSSAPKPTASPLTDEDA